MQVQNSNLTSFANSTYTRSSSEIISIQKPRDVTTQSMQNISEEEMIDPKYRSIVLALEALLGHKLDIKNFSAQKQSSLEQPKSNSPIVIYEQIEKEASHLDVSFKGNFTSKDGKDVKFDLSIKWNQEFINASRISMQDGKVMEDPLVISLDGMQPVMSEQFDFALNSKADKLNYLTQNAGYLALDKNGNDKIDNGNELFGPQSGDGFGELAKYDEDKNGWIDSGDEVYKQLRFWKPKEEDGELLSLEEVGIAAISLSSVGIDFTAKTDINTPVAHFKEASVALSEDGKAYGVFALDIAV